MQNDYRKLTDFLVKLGIEQIGHTQKNYLAHLIGVYNFMREYGQREELCRAGLFHSIYGTEKFQGFKLTIDQRSVVEQLIGPRAEHLAYWNCFMDRSSFDVHLDRRPEGEFELRNRESGEPMKLTADEYQDLCSVHLFDWLEQAPRSSFGWDYRREPYRKMAQRLGLRAIEAYEKTFLLENA